MSYLPRELPFPHATPEDEVYWQSCRERKLVIRHCHSCHTHFHPPMPSCPTCGSFDLAWRQVSGNGRIFSYTIAHHAVHPALKEHTPYNIVVVMLDDADDVRLVSNVVNATPEQIRIDAPVSLFWDEIDDGMFLPRFVLSDAGASQTQEAL